MSQHRHERFGAQVVALKYKNTKLKKKERKKEILSKKSETSLYILKLILGSRLWFYKQGCLMP